jgi:hypothetical protein
MTGGLAGPAGTDPEAQVQIAFRSAASATQATRVHQELSSKRHLTAAAAPQTKPILRVAEYFISMVTGMPGSHRTECWS